MKFIYFFGEGKADGNKDMKDLLGGKGAGLAEMARLGVPVPPGFTITTYVCRYYQKEKKFPPGFEAQFREAIKELEKMCGKKFGDEKNPLLVSVRSGAKFSMPGMMDTVLNLGLNDKTVRAISKLSNNPRFAYDLYRRFIQMFGNVVMGIEKDKFEDVLTKKKRERGVKQDIDLTANDMQEIVEEFKRIYREETGEEFPQDWFVQLQRTRDAVFNSWNNKRAREYRRINKIPDDLGTACNIQMMVYGNIGFDSATGVGFTRDPSTGEKKFYGEYLTNAQGEDVVAGIRTPKPIEKLEEELPEPFNQLKEIAEKLERHYKDIQDFEFTIERNKLYMLQTRTGQRTGLAALRIAVEMAKEKIISKEEAVMRVKPEQLEQILHPMFDMKEREKFKTEAKGLPASPGAASGVAVFDANSAVKLSKDKPVILVRSETSPDDIHGMNAAVGILTATGGMTSHAAVVARGMGKPCVVGCGAIHINADEKYFSVNEKIVKEGEWISIDGMTGEMMIGYIPTGPSEIIQVLEGKISPQESKIYQIYSEFMKWVDEIKVMGVRANADIPRDAKIARLFGAEGIGLCRTEHMFFAPDRIPLMQQMILSDSLKERREILKKLMPLQKEDFIGLFREMENLPVIIRTLDPPLHEFLPKTKEEAEKLSERIGVSSEKIWNKIQALHEFNPMLGFRGCRVGISYPEVTEMQVTAIFEAACELAKEGKKVIPEVMIPLVGHVNELKNQRELVDNIAKDCMRRYGVKIDYLVGTMIEIPRACVTADEIAEVSDFFSFGTNDLTQMTFGFSRDDIGKFIYKYFDDGIFEEDPFQVIDFSGVGELVKIAIDKGRRKNPKLEIGICGEHGGEPRSVMFCFEVGMDYVSCSPYRVPIAKLASAQKTLEQKYKKEYTFK